MNKTTKSILYGVGTFVFSIVILAVIRAVIKGVDIGAGFKDWTNWVIAAFGGISSGWSSYNKNRAKEEAKEKKGNQ